MANVSLRCCQAVAAWAVAAKPKHALMRLHNFILTDCSCKTRADDQSRLSQPWCKVSRRGDLDHHTVSQLLIVSLMTSLSLLTNPHCYLLASPPKISLAARPGKVVPNGSTPANGKSTGANQALGGPRSSIFVPCHGPPYSGPLATLSPLTRCGHNLPEPDVVPVFGHHCTLVPFKIRNIGD